MLVACSLVTCSRGLSYLVKDKDPTSTNERIWKHVPDICPGRVVVFSLLDGGDCTRLVQKRLVVTGTVARQPSGFHNRK